MKRLRNLRATDTTMPHAKQSKNRNASHEHVSRPGQVAVLLSLILLALVLEANQTMPRTRTAAGNLLHNAGFEEGVAPWFFIEKNLHWSGFLISDAMSLAGNFAAQLILASSPSQEGTRISGIVQEVAPTLFPRRIAGSYYVAHWRHGADTQYLQAAIIVFLGKDAPRALKKLGNIQIRYILNGTVSPPFFLENARYIIIEESAEKVEVGLWKHFERDLQKDFSEAWGWYPRNKEEFEKIRVLFEARYDKEKFQTSETLGEVYFDDLYVGY